MNETDVKLLLDLKPMGQATNPREDNLGLGWIYYGLVRALRPKLVVEIGSYRGFSTMCLACGIRDNSSRKGKLISIDPGMEDGYWHEPTTVPFLSRAFGISAQMWEHHLCRSDEFWAKSPLLQIDLCLIDGDHTYEGAMEDLNTYGKASSYFLFHDRLNRSLEDNPCAKPTPKRGHSCVDAMDDWLKANPEFEECTLNVGSTVNIVRRKSDPTVQYKDPNPWNDPDTWQKRKLDAGN